MHLGGVELGAARGLGDGIVQIAEAVDQLELARGAAVPHAALRDLVDTLGRQLARLADARDELAIAVLDPRLEDRVHLRSEERGVGTECYSTCRSRWTR